MDNITIDGVLLTPLKQITHPKGDVFHAMKCVDPGFEGFGEGSSFSRRFWLAY